MKEATKEMIKGYFLFSMAIVLIISTGVIAIYMNQVKENQITINEQKDRIRDLVVIANEFDRIAVDNERLYREFQDYKDRSEMIQALDPLKDLFSPDELITIIDEIPHGRVFNSDFLIMAGFGDSVTEHGKYRLHKGIDIIPTGDDWYIMPLDSGESTSVAWDSIYGKCITIQHSERVRTFYAHGETIYYSAVYGEKVEEDTIIMKMGNTGSTYSNGTGNGSHLHFEIQVFDGENWISINPLPFLERGE